MILVVDTNIVFSALINDKGKIGELLLNTPANLKFISPEFLLEELNNHAEKILAITKYDEAEYEQIKSFVIKNIDFINPDKISKNNHYLAYQLLKDVDQDDTSFLVLSMEINASLWTGDKKLIKGLQHKNYHNIITTDMLYTKYFGL